MADGLTERQARFVDAYIELGNATRAAVVAGYSEKNARFQGAENLTNPNIVRAMAIRRTALAEKHEITLEEIATGLRREANAGDPSEPNSVRVQALTALARLAGLMVDRSENKNLNMTKLVIEVKSGDGG